MEVAVDREGKLLAIRGHLRHDHGATTPSGLSLPQNSATNLHRPICLAGLSARGLALPHQSGGGDLDARRRAHARHVRDGAAARSHRRRAWPRPRRGSPSQSHHAAADALCHAGHDPRRPAHDLRQRRLSRMPAPRAGGGRLGGLPGPPRGGAQAGPLARHRPRQLRRGNRARPVRKRRGPHRTIRKDLVTTGAAAQGQGTRTMLAQLAAGVLGVRPGRSTSSTATPRQARSGLAPMPAGRR